MSQIALALADAYATNGAFLWKMAFKNEEEEQYNWLDPQEPPKESDQHFGRAEGGNPCQIFNGLYETLEEGCYRRKPLMDSDDIF